MKEEEDEGCERKRGRRCEKIILYSSLLLFRSEACYLLWGLVGCEVSCLFIVLHFVDHKWSVDRRKISRIKWVDPT